MTSELVSKKTRNEFRNFLGGWVLRDIRDEFESAHIDRDPDFVPQVSGEQRSLVEQHYRTLDFTVPADVRRLLAVYEGILERALRDLPAAIDRPSAERAIDGLKACLAKDGFKYEAGKIVAVSPETVAIFVDADGCHSISEVTRRAIFDELRVSNLPWWGRLPEGEFLDRIYNLSKLPSEDPRYRSMVGDFSQHREHHDDDWPDDWVFSDSRLNLLHTSDQEFLRFLCETVHPVVRPELGDATELVSLYNKHLNADGWELIPGKKVSGKPIFVPHRCASAHVAMPNDDARIDVLSDNYIRELSEKCDARLSGGDYDGSITVGRTLLEAILGELELRLAGVRGEYKGDLPKQFKQVAKLLRMDDQRQDIDDRFKDVIRGLIGVANGLAPLRNKLSDGHARAKKPAPHHARVVVNAAKTVATFLVESYNYQVSKGLVQEGAGKAGELKA